MTTDLEQPARPLLPTLLTARPELSTVGVTPTVGALAVMSA